jgi:hypothetical protein
LAWLLFLILACKFFLTVFTLELTSFAEAAFD